MVEDALTDGTVVSDMARSGSSLRQTVQAFAPVFDVGLKSLKNHGQIMLIVPPEPAYGERGYPPSVPPGATMVVPHKGVGCRPAGQKWGKNRPRRGEGEYEVSLSVVSVVAD